MSDEVLASWLPGRGILHLYKPEHLEEMGRYWWAYFLAHPTTNWRNQTWACPTMRIVHAAEYLEAKGRPKLMETLRKYPEELNMILAIDTMRMFE